MLKIYELNINTEKPKTQNLIAIQDILRNISNLLACINDIKLTRELFDLIQDKGEIIDPRINNFYFKKYNPEFVFKPIKVKRLKDLVWIE